MINIPKLKNKLKKKNFYCFNLLNISEKEKTIINYKSILKVYGRLWSISPIFLLLDDFIHQKSLKDKRRSQKKNDTMAVKKNALLIIIN